ncbi:MAG: crotonase/enoyl-CoA hydratase family protein, partial [Acidimicrobiales bacterium]|nr:crotonase/enoyl-CoA hydratase family protein [Acidimicrobiales bacterium]
MTDRVTVQIDDGVADVRLNRPDKLNALDSDMFVALVDTAARLAKDSSVRAVVLSGEGRAFSAGLDFSGFMAMAGGGVTPDDGAGPASDAGDGSGSSGGSRGLGAIVETDGRITHLGQQAAHGWSEVPVPVIAAIWGHCLGGGLQIALGADLRIVHPEAKLSVLEIRWGLSPDMTGTATLPRLVGPDVAKELSWTGRNVTGEEAARLGLATRTSESPLEDALALAREIAGKSPHAIRGIKRLIEQSGSVSLAEQYRDERSTIGSLIGTPNQVESVAAFFEKRDPSFADPD